MKLRNIIFSSVAALLACTAHAEQLRIASGPAGGTYHLMTEQLAKACKQELMIVNVPTSGSVTNLDALLGNDDSVKVNAAFVQIDAMRYKSNTEEGMSQIATLANLHPEAVHLVALNKTFTIAKSGLDKAKVWEKEQTYVINTLADLEGKRIGAAGGSWVTAKSIQVNGQYKFEVVKFEDGGQVIAALNAGQVDAALFVGGHPLPNIAALDKAKYKLLPIGEADQQKIAGVYAKTNVSYPKLDVSGMPTVYTTSALVARKTKSEAMLANYAALRSCLFRVLPDLQETAHKSWKSVKDDQVSNPDSRGRWAWLDLAPAQPLDMLKLSAPAKKAAK